VLFDTHCHLNFTNFAGDLQQVVDRARKAGVKFMLNVGCDAESSRKAIELSEKYSFFFASAGIHPHYCEKIDDGAWKEFEKIAGRSVVAIGECGLDYYRKLASKKKQKEIFQRQIELSRKLNLPIILHSREADEDLIAILKDKDVKGAVAHCFSGSRKYLDFCIERNFFISFAGNITYPKAGELRELARDVPLNLLLIETDCPFLTPQAERGKRCEPRHLLYTKNELSRIKNIAEEDMEAFVTSNALRCFEIAG